MKQVAIWCALCLVAAGCGGATVSDDPSKGQGNKSQGKGAAARVDLKILDYAGIQALLKSHQGKIVVMDCWSTSCEPCMEEFPGLVELHNKYGDQVACVSLSFDYTGEPDQPPPDDVKEPVMKFLREQKATFDNILTSFDSGELYEKLNFASIPAVFVYGRDGKLLKMFDNSMSKSKADNFTYEKDVEPFVVKLLKGK